MARESEEAPPADHRALAEAVANELADNDDVLSVLIGGSVGRGDHGPNSDIDLLVVTVDNAPRAGMVRELRSGHLVECIARSEAQWLARFDRPKTSWLYAFLEAVIAHDTDGSAARLIHAAHRTLDRYQTSPELRSELAVTLWHSQGKLDRALHIGTAADHAYWSGLFAPTILDALYALHNVPLPPGSRRLDYRHRLPLTSEQQRLVDALLVGDPAQRIAAAATLISQIRPLLGEGNLEAL